MHSNALDMFGQHQLGMHTCYKSS